MKDSRLVFENGPRTFETLYGGLVSVVESLLPPKLTITISQW